jgi:hypothetical protein
MVLVLLVLGGLVRAGEGPAGRLGEAIDSATAPVFRKGSSLGAGVLRYFRGRANDALDLVEVNLGIGWGLKAGVEYAVLRTTLGQVKAQRVGMDSRQLGLWGERNVAFGIFPASLLFAPFELVKNQGDTWRVLAEGGFELGTIGVERTRREGFATTSVLYHEAVMAGPWHERTGDCGAIGGELHLGLFGARARAKPLEFVDFLVGFLGVDLDPQLAHPNPRGGGPRR